MQQIQLNIIPFTPVASKGTFSFYGEKQSTGITILIFKHHEKEQLPQK